MNYEIDIFTKFKDEDVPAIIEELVFDGKISNLVEKDEVGNTLYAVAKKYKFTKTLTFLALEGGVSSLAFTSSLDVQIKKENLSDIINNQDKFKKEKIDEEILEVEKEYEDIQIKEKLEKKPSWRDELKKVNSKKKVPVKKNNNSNVLKEKTEKAINYVKLKKERIMDIKARILNDPAQKRNIK